MSEVWKLLLALWLLVYFPNVVAQNTHVDDSQTQAKASEKKANDIMQGLYFTLRSIALPNSPNSNKKVTQRFVLMSPGKVLNFFDYYPGEQYESSVQDINTSTREYVVPPKTMENWFDLADVVPGVDPLTGGENGESFSQKYQEVLDQIEIEGFDKKTAEEQKRYKNAIGYLNEIIPDPENLTQNVTRLALYNRFQDLYNERRLQMEDIINEKRQSMPAIEYELWFQRNYPSLQSLVESAYTRWLVFGQKEIVELYKAYFDTGVSGQNLEVARMALRASGVSALDRTRTIYPVKFVPSDWYKYLLPSRHQGLSRDQLQAKIGMIKSKLAVLQSIMDQQQNLGGAQNLTNKRNTYKHYKEATANNASRLMRLRAQCMETGNSRSSACSKFRSAQESTTNALFQQAQSYSEWQSLDFIMNVSSSFHIGLEKQIDQLKRELQELEEQLSGTLGYLGDIVESQQLDFSNLTDIGRDDAWLQFYFDSQSSQQDTKRESSSVSFASSFSVGGLFWSASGSFGYSRSESNFAASVAGSRVKASGELLRVQILRPWFRPTLFEDPNLSFSINSGGKRGYVSPGYSSEQDFVRALTEDSTVSYLLPEYATGFLLAREIDLEFSGIDASTASHMVQTSMQSSLSIGIACFSASASYGENHQKSSFQAKRTADGLKISIPGAQIIGYFTEIVPKFPTQQPL